MVVILSHFHSVMGPLIAHVYPSIELTDDIKFIPNMMDIKNDIEGFFLTADDTGDRTMRLMNCNFTIPSPSNKRGGIEMLMLSYMITESDGNVNFIKEQMKKTVNDMKMNADVYTAFYMDTDGCEDAQKFIENELKTLDMALRKSEMATIGYMDSTNVMRNTMTIPIPIVRNSPSGKFLLIYKEENNGEFKVIGIPASHRLYKLDIYTLKINMSLYKMVIESFNKLGGKILYSSGICQGKKGVCLFEAYFEYEGDKENITNMRSDLEDKIQSDDPRYPVILWSSVNDGRSFSRS